MKTWQKWTLGCLAGIAIPLALAGGCLMLYAVFLTEPTPGDATAIASTSQSPTFTPEPPATVVPTSTTAPTPTPYVSDMAYANAALPMLEGILGGMNSVQVLAYGLGEDPMLMFDTEVVSAWRLAVITIDANCDQYRALEPGPTTGPAHQAMVAACDDLRTFGKLTMQFFDDGYDVALLDEALPYMVEAGDHITAATALLPVE